MPQYPYKKQVIAGDVPELKPFDYTRQLDAIARDMGDISQKTAQMAQQHFLNTFELESRKALAESYERNMNNPAQLEAENNKIMVKFVSALPTKEMREEAKARFGVHAMGYLGKAKENLYNQQFKELQASTLDRTNVVLNDIQGLGKDLHNANLGVSGTAANSIGLDIVSLEQMLTQKDERGNMVMSPERQASLRNEVRKRLTASDLDHFNDLETLAQKQAFYNQYKDKKAKKIWLDPNDERGYSEQGMNDNNTDWNTYQSNLEAMAKTLQSAKQESLKGLAEQEKNQFAINKIKVLTRLDVAKEQLANDEKVNPFKVLSFLQQVNDLTTNGQTAYQGSDGRLAYYLEPSEAYSYQKDVLKNYWDDTIATLEKQPDKTYFSYGLGAINQFFEKDRRFRGLNEYDKMDIMQEYYRQMVASVPAEALQSRVDIAYQKETMDAAQRAIQNFAMRSKKYSQFAKNMILTTPKDIQTTIVEEIEKQGPRNYYGMGDKY